MPRRCGPHWYLAGIGVDPSEQRQGIGAALLQPGIDGAARDGVPAVLLTNSEVNLSFYEGTVSRSCARRRRPRMARTPGLWSGNRERRRLDGVVNNGTPKRFPDRDEIARVRAEAEALEPGEDGPEPGASRAA